MAKNFFGKNDFHLRKLRDQKHWPYIRDALTFSAFAVWFYLGGNHTIQRLVAWIFPEAR